MAVYQIDPLTDARWPAFLERHPDASAFHSAGWLRALKQTYRYEPVVYTTAAPGQELENGIPFCRVKSWLTGKRLVSLPFSDHCQPLVDVATDMHEIRAHLESEKRNGFKYVELRPLAAPAGLAVSPDGFGEADSFYMHELDLRPPDEELFRAFHKSCVQRPIKKAEKEGLLIESGHTREHLKMFYHLLMLTRRRHQLPPQPIEWFDNVLQSMPENAKVWVARKGDQPVASIFTMLFKQKLMYKYGCSDSGHFNLGGTFALFWHAIREAKGRGATSFDLGRSEVDNEGLVTFKDRWGANRRELHYLRFPAPAQHGASEKHWASRIIRSTFSVLPDPILVFAGRALYRHKG